MALLLPLLATATVEFCVNNSLGFVTSLATTCPQGSQPFRHSGTNLFDIFWDGWDSTSSANMTTSLKSVRDAGATGFSVARVFAVPWGYTSTWGWLNESTRDAYWSVVDTLLEECSRVGLQIIPSLGYGCADGTLACNPSVLCPGEAYRDLVINSSSCTRSIVIDYAVSFVQRYRSNPTILFWELGNEINLSFDGCTYDKSPGAFFTAAEGLAFLDEYAAAIHAVDPLRPINSGMASPRLRARQLAATPGGGRNCVNPANPKGDCELYCPGLAYDTQEDSVAVFESYYANRSANGMGIASLHWYSCDPPYGNYSWCPETGGNTTTVPLTVFKQVRGAVVRVFYYCLCTAADFPRVLCFLRLRMH